MAARGFVGIRFSTTCCTHGRTRKTELIYACRNCDHKEVADNPCIYVNKLLREVDELTQINADVVHDPTLPKTKEQQCPACHNKGAVFRLRIAVLTRR
ncbi:hypothetical protein L596_021857 [Steinernema carpocapsae]|uniref:DNA-directed RNA polymerase M/15kDa subunit domain-containing protein n=1 Tax=Steinernema carpocapsae TaxID=34508 RepID=A0A4U5MKU1_STECR|nr:hypothetical protein L596_021857 [Steinernema carpocapsae]